MDFIFISMPYARFISRWFANVPNINLGIMQALLKDRGKSVKTFHFHLDFLPYLKTLDPQILDNLLKITEQYGVEYMGADYLFATLLFEEKYLKSKDLFRARLESFGLSLVDFERLREVARRFIDSAFSRLTPYMENTRLIGFSSSHYQLSSSLLMCSMIKDSHPDTSIILGGKDCSGAFAQDLLKNVPYVDFIGTGECELTVESLLDHIEDPMKDFYNVLYRDGGSIKKSQSKPNLQLNTLPFPDYDFPDFPVHPSEIIMPIEFGRGCPWKRCTFCPDESYNILCQTKSASRLKDEICRYREISKDLRNFFILDSDTLKDPRVIIEMADYLDGKDINFHYAEFRAERMNRELLASILRFGHWVSNFQIGIETFSERVLQLMNKGVTALKNVEVLKAVAELGVPVQFNLFTCFPKMTKSDLDENIRIMDLITHILASEKILICPGEFYLPTDCPVFLSPDQYGLRKDSDSIFSLIFEDFAMPSYSNYPYPYQFDNDEEQFRISEILRNKVDEIKNRNISENYMVYQDSPDGLFIEVCRSGNRKVHTLQSKAKDIYLSAVEEVQDIGRAAGLLGLPVYDIYDVLDDLDHEGLILYSADRKSFLSLATKKKS